uniref:Uncharacterized protein n=1 Tax=Alexandrium monilatum TaxID=311494 RepID=A0A7S4W240_9DINO
MDAAAVGERWRLLAEGPVLGAVWRCLSGDAVLQMSRAQPELWRGGLDLVPGRLQNRTLFALLTSSERGAALQALPALEKAMLFENFCRPLAERSHGDARGPEASVGRWVTGPGTFVPPTMERCLVGLGAHVGRPLSPWCLRMENTDLLCNLDPSGLVWCFPQAVRPRTATFRCRPAAPCPQRPAPTAAAASSPWRRAWATIRGRRSRQCL